MKPHVSSKFYRMLASCLIKIFSFFTGDSSTEGSPAQDYFEKCVFEMPKIRRGDLSETFRAESLLPFEFGNFEFESPKENNVRCDSQVLPSQCPHVIYQPMTPCVHLPSVHRTGCSL